MFEKIYIISHFESSLHVLIHAVMIQGHKQGVDHDAECDKELDERVVNEKAHKFLEFNKAGRTVPDAANVEPFERQGDESLFDFGSLFVVIHCVYDY